jgi:hypothetical protein
MKAIYRSGRKFLFLALVIFCVPGAEAAYQGRKVGLGFSAGVPSGLNAKVWFSHKNALDVTAGWGFWNFWVKADYLWHDWKAIGDNEDMQIPLYYGLGGFAGGSAHDVGIGPEGVIGLDFILKKAPFDFFIELGPAIQLIESPGGFIHGAFGARYYFAD